MSHALRLHAIFFHVGDDVIPGDIELNLDRKVPLAPYQHLIQLVQP
jgi:hypothetical protein